MVTNDGATILKSIALDNAAAKVLVCCVIPRNSSTGSCPNKSRSTSLKSKMMKLEMVPRQSVSLLQNYFVKRRNSWIRNFTPRL